MSNREKLVTINRRDILAGERDAVVVREDGSEAIGPVVLDDAIQAAVNIVGGKTTAHTSVTKDSNNMALALVVLAADAGAFDPKGRD